MLHVNNEHGELVSFTRVLVPSLLFFVPASIFATAVLNINTLIDAYAVKYGARLVDVSTVEKLVNSDVVRTGVVFTAWLVMCFLIARTFSPFLKRMRMFFKNVGSSQDYLYYPALATQKIVKRSLWVLLNFVVFILGTFAVLLQVWWADEALHSILRSASTKNIVIFLVRCLVVGILLALTKVIFMANHKDDVLSRLQ